MSFSGLRVVSSAFTQIALKKRVLGLAVCGVLNGVRATETSFRASSSLRSLWCLASYGSRNSCLVGAKDGLFGCNIEHFRSLHTTGDHELVDFLKDEIKVEKDIEKKSGKLPKIKNFEVTKADGPNVVLTRKIDHETVTVKFNVNNTVEDSAEAMDDEHHDETQGSQMVSRPPFVVEINKGGDKTLALHCVFRHPEDIPPPAEQDENEQFDLIEIQDVALLNKSQEWTDDVYSLSSTVMDGNLYDMLLKLLEERGIDGDFLDQIVDFSTSFEHRRYIELLEQLKDFADSK